MEEIRYGFVLLIERRGHLAVFHRLDAISSADRLTTISATTARGMRMKAFFGRAAPRLRRGAARGGLGGRSGAPPSLQSLRVEELDRLLVDLHVLAVGDGRR